MTLESRLDVHISTCKFIASELEKQIRCAFILMLLFRTMVALSEHLYEMMMTEAISLPKRVKTVTIIKFVF